MNNTHTNPEINSYVSVALCSPKATLTRPYFFEISYKIKLIKTKKTEKYQIKDFTVKKQD